MTEAQKENLFVLIKTEEDLMYGYSDEIDRCEERIEQLKEMLKHKSSYSHGLFVAVETLGLREEYLEWKEKKVKK